MKGHKEWYFAIIQYISYLQTYYFYLFFLIFSNLSQKNSIILNNIYLIRYFNSYFI